MTQAIEHSAHLTALVADGLDLDRRCLDAKAEGACLFAQGAIENRIVDLGHAPADAAHQELAGMLILGAVTAQEGIQCIETMHESGFLEELQCPVNSGRSGLFTILGQLGQDLVGPDRLVLAPDDLEDAPSQWSQVHLLRCTDPFGRRDRALDAARVVMRRSLSVYHSGHATLFGGPSLDGRKESPAARTHGTV